MRRTLSHFTMMFDLLSAAFHIADSLSVWETKVPFFSLSPTGLSVKIFCVVLLPYSIRPPEVQGKEIGFCQIILSFLLPPSPPPPTILYLLRFPESNAQNPTSGRGRKREFANKTKKKPLPRFLYISCVMYALMHTDMVP